MHGCMPHGVTLSLQLHSLGALRWFQKIMILAQALSTAPALLSCMVCPGLTASIFVQLQLTQYCEPGLQVNQVVEIGNRQEGRDKFDNISKWANQINTLRNTVLNKLQ